MAWRHAIWPMSLDIVNSKLLAKSASEKLLRSPLSPKIQIKQRIQLKLFQSFLSVMAQLKKLGLAK